MLRLGVNRAECSLDDRRDFGKIESGEHAMTSETKLGMLIGLICVVMLAIIQAGPRSTDLRKTPTPAGPANSLRLDMPIPDV